MQQVDVAKWVDDSGMMREYAADLGDGRRTRRAQRMGVALATRPELSLPKIFVDEADLEGAYRLLRNPQCHWRALLAAHINRTLARARGFDEVLVAHDTTDVSFRQYWPDSGRAHMSEMSSRRQGFLLHASVAIAGSGQAVPLGVLDLQPFVHRSGLDPNGIESQQFWEDEYGLFDNEHQRWFRNIGATDDALAGQGVRPVHVMDSETDSYGLLSWMQRNEFRFVARGSGSRRLKVDGELLEVGTVEAQLGERFPLRSGKKANRHPSRKRRSAMLTVRVGQVTLARTRRASDASWSPGGFDEQPRQLVLNLVEAVEEHPPKGEQGVSWLLLTSEPVDTSEQALQVVDWYRRRWLIEEYFKALKTGCRLEDRQMESMENMLRMLALIVPAAWRLLALRAVAEAAPETRWTYLLTPLEFRLLSRKLPKARLTNGSSVADCLAAIAKLGGHLPRNGRPGWQSLHAGWRRLQDLVEGVQLARGDAINP